MPKRSNAFQQVVTLLHEQFAGGGIVTESKLLPDSRTGKRREVDIVIEAPVVEYPIIMSIECIDHNRPASVEWVEQMMAKHADLPTNKLVLVSRSGFTRQAQQKADALYITTLALARAEATDWTLLVGKLPEIGIETLDFTYQGFIIVKSSQGQEALAAPRELTLRNESGTHHVFGALLDYLVAIPEVGATFLDEMKSASKTHGTFTLEHDFPEPMVCIGPTHENFVVHSLRIVFSAERGIVPVPLVHGEMRDARLAYGEVTGASGRVRVSVVEKHGQSPVFEVKKQDGKEWRRLVNADLKTPGIVLNKREAT